MSESLKQVLARLESKVKELSGEVSTLKASKAIVNSADIDVKKEIKSIVTIGFVTNLYRGK